MAFVNLVLDHSAPLLCCIATTVFLTYIVYQRCFHPLAKYPGPFLASLTDLWQVYQFLTLKQPYRLTELHEKYGPFVRYGPDKLSTTCESAISLVFQKGGRHMPKTEFYDAYGAAHPNVFGMRDEAQHSLRRRHMSHSFSIASVKEMEEYLDLNIGILKQKLDNYALSGEEFDLKKAFHYYVIDTLGELAFSQSFGVQVSDDESLVPPVKEHSLLAAATGSWPAMLSKLKQWLPLVPYQPLQNLFRGRKACADLAARCVARRLDDLADVKDDDTSIRAQRKDILTSLILAKHPDTGARLTKTDLETEAFGFIIAGTHTTSATTTLLFYQLLHHPEMLAKLVSELDRNLPPLNSHETSHSITLLEASLPYLRNCIKENFRINPVFTMPLARRVMPDEGIIIDGEHIQAGTSIAVCNHAFHHNPAVWGPDHNTFRPSRWDEPDTNARSRFLMHFGLGGRQCIGKTIATTNIYKLTSSLLSDYEFELVGKNQPAPSPAGVPEDVEHWAKTRASQCKFAELGAVEHGKSDVPPLVSVGISDLEGSLLVRCKKRKKASEKI
ncbi:uncharacterized protein A1O5_12963 [Cladophialophora psammophila CBS 110553]|uniref:Cytochrome P450 oxidoreductase n=1 Tax=Cladophialophora psammophila CBS 110553 TaxID=1182543 RepID=W9VGZ9_9EURO|nr:uncharacterized protein A1O5_12963 [Cladophialophora psammophila CBS 110553]EXJ54897.1 hypothetical protein A1O5_12963 [Cladophialophora psammophila CBS 110553]